MHSVSKCLSLQLPETMHRDGQSHGAGTISMWQLTWHIVKHAVEVLVCAQKELVMPIRRQSLSAICADGNSGKSTLLAKRHAFGFCHSIMLRQEYKEFISSLGSLAKSLWQVLDGPDDVVLKGATEVGGQVGDGTLLSHNSLDGESNKSHLHEDHAIISHAKEYPG